jgi:membrane protein implicated in regulation of membrane protease activity
MFIKPKSRSTRGYTIYAIVGTILESLILLIVLFIILPLFSINLEWWIIVLIVLVELAISAFTYIMGRRALSRSLIYGSDSLIGCVGTVSSSLDPVGYIKIRGELWKAVCNDKAGAGTEVVVTEMKGLKLRVIPREKSDFMRENSEK